jgi:hypothetical protein
MENQPSRKIYTLYLNSNTGFKGLISNSDYANVSWLVDWDSLFNRENYIYKYCNVRFRMIGEINASIIANDQTLGMITANFGQNYTGKNTSYVVLAPINLKRVASYSGGTYTNEGNMIDVETMSHGLGQQIDMPTGLKPFNIQLWKDAFGCIGDPNNVLVDSSSAHQYYILFQFELY